uniref:tRNA (32-2'-O)-methyltransferase regulator THADA n=1 Tax=Crassostrea virginica TaxID=6565 RepID=A0A8B8DWX3_CRAVI|nr:thyroid adenoma-associated protein homolog isoform X4 [Crassostrea virginica]
MTMLQSKEHLSYHELLTDKLVKVIFKDGQEKEKRLLRKFQELFGLKDIKQQIVCLKEICKEVQECHRGVNNELERDLSLEILINIYLNCTPKNTVKRLLASNFQNFSDDLKVLVSQQMVQEVTLKVMSEVKDTETGRRTINMIYCLMENFALGEQCLTQVFFPVFQFLSRALELFMVAKRSDLSPVEDNEVMHHCLACVQALSKLLQRCGGGGIDFDPQGHIPSVSMTIINNIILILKSENFLLDCKTSGSMCLTLLLKLNLGPKATDLILEIIFSESAGKDFCSPAWIKQTSLTRDELSQLSPTSCLCLWCGILAQLDVSDLLQHSENQKSLLLDIMLDRVLAMESRGSDATGKLQMARAVLMWTTRARACLQWNCCEVRVCRELTGTGHLLQKVLKFIWTIWEDSTDVIRFTAKDIFESVIKVHKASVAVLEVSWTSKGKYGTLRILAENMKVSSLLQFNPDLAMDILNNLKEQTVACYASDLYDKLLSQHLKELSIADNREKWQKIWVWPVLRCMMGISTQQRTYVIEYILPKLLKTGKDTLGYMISSLCDSNQSVSDEQLGALIMCLRRARVMGLLDNTVATAPDHLYGVVNTELVKQALSHTDDQARLDAFALLCENHKTSEPISQSEFRLIKYFIQWNMKNQSPSFRQHMVAHIKKLFLRFKESEGALCRKMVPKNKFPEVTTALSIYKAFGSWLFHFLLHSLYPGSAFARRTTALSILSLLVHILNPGNNRGFDLWEEWQGCHIQTLMECLTDTFEDNKIEAYIVLKHCFSQGLHLKKMINLSEVEVLDIGLALAGSNRPQDCTTGAYLLRVLLLQPNIQDYLVGAQEILTNFLTPSTIAHWEDLLNGTQSLTGALQMLPLSNHNSSGGTILLLWILLLYLKEQLQVAKTGLFIAAATKPMYPTLHCIRYILFDINLKKLPTEEMLLWQPLMEELLHCCLAISDIVSPVVQNSSPEGNVPEEAIKGVESIFTSEGKVSASEAERCVETITLMPEYLIVCCWRNVKEVSLLLGQLTFEAPITAPLTSDIGLLTVKQNEIIGEYFKKQLMESIHRGAFELACAGFVKQCEMLWRCNIKSLHKLPKLWLEQVMDDIRNDDENNKLCATRRSAGLPFFVQTLVSSEPPSTGRPCFKWTMRELLQLALKEDLVSGTPSNSKVHALNILRALYKDSRLGEVVTTFVADGLRASILGFQSPFWAVRNSSTLLLSTMITRIFGVKRSKDESTMSKKNCQTGRQFFHQYPSLYPFLLNQLELATQNISDTSQLHLHPGLYPVLMILGRLFQSPLEGADTSLNLAAFIPHIIRCSSSPVLKTRIMAAKALQPLVQKGQLNSVMAELLDIIPSIPVLAKHSHVHGVLLQVGRNVVQNNVTISKTILSMIDVMLTMAEGIHYEEPGLLTWTEKMWLVTKQNPCYLTKQAAFEVSEKMLCVLEQSWSVQKSPIIGEIKTKMEKALDEEFQSGVYNKQAWEPGFVEYLTVIAKLELQHMLHNCKTSDAFTTKFEVLLDSKLYEVRLVVLDMLMSLFTEIKKCKELPSPHMERSFTMTTMSSAAWDCVMSLLPCLLEMALYREQHFECQVKVFKVLDLHPLLEKKDWKDLCLKNSSAEILQQCLFLIQSSRREEVKAVVTKFIRWLMQDFLEHWTDECLVTVDALIAVLKDGVRTEKITDLQLSVAMVIKHNAIYLLRDSHTTLGTKRMMEFWEMLTSLQQEDDPEVREIITMTLRILGNARAVQPSLTLDSLVRTFVELHSRTKGANCLLTLISWIVDNESSNEGSERLFDKSEMNVFREDVLFYQILVKYCLVVIQSASIKQGNLAVSPDNTGKSIVASSDHSMKNSQKSEAVSSGQNTNYNIEGILTRLQLVADREEKDFVNYDKMVPQEKVDFAMVLELIRAFLLKESPCSVVYEKGTPFLKTSVFQEGLLNQYKIGMLRSIYNLLGDLTGLPTSKEKPQSGTEKNTYPNCFVLC